MNITCQPGEIKIHEDNSLRICSEGEWHALCGDSESWTVSEAQVTCHHQGLPFSGVKLNSE